MIGVAVMGCGVVGSGTVKMLTQNADRVCRAAGTDVRLRTALDIREVAVPEGVAYTARFEDVLEDPAISIAVETIGGCNAAYTYTKRLLAAGKSVVTSNKELVAEKGDELLEIARQSGARYLYEASVAGAIPVLRPIGLCMAGNRFLGVEGIVNGSTNYILTRMEKGAASFSSALEEARMLGYVEGNPSADIDGHDARRKLAILAHDAFGSRFSDSVCVPCEGIRAVVTEDIRAAKLFGGKVKLIARAKAEEGFWTGSVRPTVVLGGHSLCGIDDVFNAVLLRTDFADETLFIGRGAGSLPTASAVVGDIIDIAKGRSFFSGGEQTVPLFREEEAKARWLVRYSGTKPDIEGEEREGEGVRAMLTRTMTETEMRVALEKAVSGRAYPVLE